jgi:LysM repeat protein
LSRKSKAIRFDPEGCGLSAERSPMYLGVFSMLKALVSMPTHLRAGLVFLLALLMLATSIFLPGATPLFAQSSDDQSASGFMVDINQNATTTYIVQRGDTLGAIARRHNTDVSTLLRLNPQIQNPNRINAGQRILVPVPSSPPRPPAPNPRPPSGIALTYIHMIGLGNNGPLGCGDTVVPVLQEVPATNAILRATLQRLLSINTQFFRQTGLYNALYLSQLSISDVSIVNRVATIRLSGRIVMSGTCDGPRIQAQLEEAALQFLTVDQVQIFINGNRLQDVLSQQ